MKRETIGRIARRYQGRWLQGYARGKLRSDPVYGAAFAVLKNSPLPVLDVGCGMGLFECYVRECGGTMPMAGFDFDERKIAHARRGAAHYSGVEFHAADATRHAGQRGNVVIFDVLHNLDAAGQADLLARLAAMIPPGGCCVIRETPNDGSWRFRVTLAEEWLVAAIRWMKFRARHFPSVAEVCAPFRARGFACEVRPLWGGTPFNSHLFVFRAPVDPAPGVREDEDRDERVEDEAERAGAAEAGEADVVRPADGAEARGG